MNYDRSIEWDDLPHHNFIGHGVEGLVLRLDENRGIKIYSPERSFSSEREFINYKLLRENDFLVQNRMN